MLRRFIAPRPAAIAILALVAICYALLTIYNHLEFHTFGLDLGFYTHSLYEYANFRSADCSFFLPDGRPVLADHFDLYLPLLSPLVWVFGGYTLLLVQVAAVLAGGWGVYRLMGTYGRPWLAVAAMATFYAFFGIWQALGVDYHSNVVASMFVPWIMYSLRRGRYLLFSLFTVAACIGKETMPIWLFFVLLALLWDYRRDRTAMWWIAGGMAFCMAYELLVVKVFMPLLWPERAAGFGRYLYMGANVAEVGTWILSHPLQALSNFFTDFTPNHDGPGLKPEFALCLLLPCGLLTLLKPNWLLMLVPLLMQKMLSEDISLWGISYQYNVEFAAVVVPASFIVLASVRRDWLRRTAAIGVMLLTLLTTVYTTASPKTWIRRENVRIFDVRHYHQDNFRCRDAHRLMEAIPADASVCASSCLTPHLALRHNIYLFPNGMPFKPEYLLLVDEDAEWLTDDDKAVWHAVDSADGLVLYKRNTHTP